MGTVSYFSQPAIHKTRGTIPLAGNSYLYRVEKLLWPKDVESYLEALLIGKSLHVCSGKSKIGDVRLDLYEKDVNVMGDMSRLPFSNQSFDTVLIDPPYNSKLQIMHNMLAELSRVARKRIIFQHWFSPVDKVGYYRKNHKFILTGLYNWMPKTYFGRMQIISVFDTLENWKDYLVERENK